MSSRAALAMPVVAEQGFGGFSIEQIAEQADVTRGNLYRYFPRGRPDIVAAVVREAGRELTTGWVTDPELSLEQRLQANIARSRKPVWAFSSIEGSNPSLSADKGRARDRAGGVRALRRRQSRRV
jgi:AcrR family transcriptional regulator